MENLNCPGHEVSTNQREEVMQKVDGQSGGILRTRNQRESSLFRLKIAAVVLADTG